MAYINLNYSGLSLSTGATKRAQDQHRYAAAAKTTRANALRVPRRSAEIVAWHSGAPCAEAKRQTWVAPLTLSAARIARCSTWNMLMRNKDPKGVRAEVALP